MKERSSMRSINMIGSEEIDHTDQMNIHQTPPPEMQGADVEEASVTSEDVHHSMPNPGEIEAPRKSNRYVWLVVGLLVAIAIGTAVGLAVGLQESSSDVVENAGSARDSNSDKKRKIKLQRYFVKYGVSTPADYEDPDSAQSKAIDFLAFEDKQQLDAPLTNLRSKEGYSLLTRYVMAVLYHNLDGPNWNFDLLFLSDHDTCYWFSIFQPPIGQLGVICNQNTREITGFSFIGDELSGELPKEISHLTTLSYIESVGNDIRGSIPFEYNSLTNLRTLVFAFNSMTGAIPAWIGRLSRLEFLYLSNNLFTGKIPVELEELPNLRVLALDDNAFDGSMNGLWELSKLEYLYTDHNQFTGQLPITISTKSPNLINLDVSKNRLNGNLPQDLFALPNLELLDLHGNSFGGNLPGAEDIDFSSLKFLAMHENSISGQIPNSLSNLSTLEHVDLSENRLTGFIPNFTPLTELTYMFLAENSFSLGTIPHFLFDCTNLRELSLKNTNQAGPLLPVIGNLKNLIVLDLDNNSLTGEIPSEIGDLNDLEFLLLNRNQFNSTLPMQLNKLDKLRMALLNGNDLTGFFDPICEISSLEVAYSDCNSTTCDCCEKCCEDAVDCHDYNQVAQMDPSWERNYRRAFFDFSLTKQGFEHKSDQKN